MIFDCIYITYVHSHTYTCTLCIIHTNTHNLYTLVAPTHTVYTLIHVHSCMQLKLILSFNYGIDFLIEAHLDLIRGRVTRLARLRKAGRTVNSICRLTDWTWRKWRWRRHKPTSYWIVTVTIIVWIWIV